MTRITFFGSDIFSLHSLQKLTQCYKSKHGLIDELHVVTRSVKPQGRKKMLIDYPVGTYAQKNGLPLYRAESKQDILDLGKHLKPELAIAVSYGKLIPSEFLSSLSMGGLNVHPSLLPRWSGSSPIQHALMNDDLETGVTIQTLHPTKFDHGDIILQSDPVPIHENDDFNSMIDKLGILGADLLEQTLIDKLYLNPPKHSITNSLYKFSLAPKICPETSRINWDQKNTRQIIRLFQALGPIHTFIQVNSRKDGLQSLKVQLKDLIPSNTLSSLSQGYFKIDETTDRLIIGTIDGSISVGQIKLQYSTWKSAKGFISDYQKKNAKTSIVDKFD